MKQCSRCRETKPFAEFHRRTKSTDGFNFHCRACEKTHKRKRYLADSSKEIAKSQRYYRNNRTSVQHRERLRRYGLTQEQFETMMVQQNRSCDICLEPFSKFKKAPFVDHNHLTGTIRGLLCQNCNSLIGFSREDAHVFIAAMHYLENYETELVLFESTCKAKSSIDTQAVVT